VTRVRLLFAICCAVAILAVPQSALAVGPMLTPKVFFTEGFETAVPVTYVTSPYLAGGLDEPGYWKRVIAPQVVNPAHGGVASLWCDGTNPKALFRAPHKYADGSQGYATFSLTQTVDYYKPVVSLYYSFPSAGYSDSISFAPEWAATGAQGVSSALSQVSFPTLLNEWKPMSINLAAETTSKTSLSRTAGMFRLRWKDQTEPYADPAHITNGQGPSVDDVTISGWKFGPVRSLSATTTSISSTLTWNRPLRSATPTETSVEERPLSYRVWRAPRGFTDPSEWTELTPAVRTSNPTTGTITYTDTTVTDGTAYTYAVQAWGPGTGDDLTVGYGEHLSIDATTKPFPVPLVSISKPASGTVVVSTVATGIAGTVQALDGATVSSVIMTVKREDNQYFNSTTGLWTGTPTTFAADVVGTTWSSAWIPTANDYKTHTYTITAAATDSRNKKASSVVTVKADSVPYVAPVSTVTSPAASAVVVTTGTFAVTGSATVQTGLPTPTVEVSLAHGANYWNGSAWSSTPTWLPATVVGTAWTLSGVQPPANEYKSPTYVATARATDAHLLTGTSAARTFTVDSVPYVAPTVSVSTTANPDLVGTGAFTISGTAASVHPNLPLVPGGVRVTIARDTSGTVTWWNGSTWVSSETSVAAVGTSTWSYNWTPPANEYHKSTFTIRASALDDHGMVGTSSSTSMLVDSVPYIAPVAAVVSPSANATVTTTGSFAVTGTATVQTGLPAATVQVRLAHGSTWWNGSVWTTVETWVPATVVGSAWTLSGVTPPANEFGTPTYVATARATDAHVLTGTSATRTFTVDSVPFVAPTVGLSFPENNVDVIGVGPYTLRGTVTPVHPNLPLTTGSVRVFIKKDTAGAITWWNGSAWVGSETSVAASGTASWTYIWPPPVNEQLVSTFTVYATASDAHGLTGTSASSVFQVNSVAPNPPDILFTTPSGALTSQVGTLTVAGTTAGRDGAEVQRVSLHIGRSSGATGTPTSWWDGTTWTASETSATYIDTTYSAGAPTWSYDWKMPANEYAARTYVLRAYAYDEFSRIGTSTPVSTQLDTVPWTAPTVNMTPPTSGPDLVGTGSHTITGTVTPVHPSLPLATNSVRVKIARDTAGDVTWWDGSAWVAVETSVAAVGTSAWSYTWTPPANEYRKSTYTVHATALDAHGVMGTSASSSFMVDSVPYIAPVTTIASPSANATLTTIGTISVTGTATVQTGLPAPAVEVRIAHGSTWWSGSAWTTSETWVPATLTGTTWRLDGIQPPVKEYGTPTYVATARTTDAHALTGTSATRTFKVDSVPLDPPTTTVYPPTANPAPAQPITISGAAALAASVQGSPITLSSVRVTIEAKSNTGTKSWWNGTGWSTTQGSVPVAGSLSPWSVTFTSKPYDNRVYTYTIMSTATDTHGLSGNSAPVIMSADNVGPRIVSARSLGRYAIEVRFSEQPFAPRGAGPIDGRYFSAPGMRIRRVIGWSNDGTRVRLMTSAQSTPRSSIRVTLRKPVVDNLGN